MLFFLTSITRLSATLILIFTALVAGIRAFGTTLHSPQVAVLHTEKTLHLIDLRTRMIYPLIQNADSTPVGFHWSPDGRKLVYSLLSNNSYTLYIRDMVTQETAQIMENTLIPSANSWSPDSQTLALLSPELEICLLTITTMEMHCLGVAIMNFPVWTPDGKTLVVNIAAGTDAGTLAIDVDTGEVRRFADVPVTQLLPVWSPDGRYAAFLIAESDGSSAIYLTRGDGSSPRLLIAEERQITEAAWSPDSHRMMMTVETQRNRDLYVVDVESGESRAVMDETAVIEARPAWSPDGDLLGFVRYSGGTLQLYTIDGRALTPASAQPVIDIRSYNFAWRPLR